MLHKEGVSLKKLWFMLPSKSILDLALPYNRPNIPILHTTQLVRSGGAQLAALAQKSWAGKGARERCCLPD